MLGEINLDLLQREAEAINRVVDHTGRPPDEVIAFMRRDRVVASLITNLLDEDTRQWKPPFKAWRKPPWEEIRPELDTHLAKLMTGPANDNHPLSN